MKVVPQCAIQMSVYDGVKDLMQRRSGSCEKLSNGQHLIAGGRPEVTWAPPPNSLSGSLVTKNDQK